MNETLSDNKNWRYILYKYVSVTTGNVHYNAMKLNHVLRYLFSIQSSDYGCTTVECVAYSLFST